MKATTGKTDDTFKPVNITVTLESENEVAALYALFNNCPVIDAVDLDGEPIRDALEKAVEVNRIKSEGYHRRLNAISN